MRSLVVAAAFVLGAQSAFAGSGDWLDKPLSTWNQAGASLPTAPEPKGDSPNDPRCAGPVRQPATPSERAVAAVGWSLYGKAQAKGDTTVLLAEASVDGMCRPWDYQAFVFVKGTFAGALSPVFMDSRTDGALSEVRLLSPTSIEVTFMRYVDADPLCCPSRLSTVRYRIEHRPQGPAVAPLSVKTKSTLRAN
jgi:LppP/LprE lipoprotein